MCDRVSISAINISKIIAATRLNNAAVVVDATCGNGHDTLFIAKHVQGSTRIIAFDVQMQAIENTRQRLRQHGFENRVELKNESFVNIPEHLTFVDVVIFNLGYLPGSDHAVKTLCATTVEAVNKVCALLTGRGIILITAYPGHSEGAQECVELDKLLEDLPQHGYNCAKYAMLNQINSPPQLYIIEKR